MLISSNIINFLNRFFFDCALLLVTLTFPWWATLIIVTIFAYRLGYYPELIAVGIIMDSLWGTPVPALFMTHGLVTVAVTVLAITIWLARSYWRQSAVE